MKGFEPLTPSLPWKCSTPELHWPLKKIAPGFKNWSGRRDSNSRPSAWKADALPTELLPQCCQTSFQRAVVGMIGFEPIQA